MKARTGRARQRGRGLTSDDKQGENVEDTKVALVHDGVVDHGVGRGKGEEDVAETVAAGMSVRGGGRERRKGGEEGRREREGKKGGEKGRERERKGREEGRRGGLTFRQTMTVA